MEVKFPRKGVGMDKEFKYQEGLVDKVSLEPMVPSVESSNLRVQVHASPLEPHLN